MSNIKILDCTLRDGGYANNWEFGCENIIKIIKTLDNTSIDFIECGYLKNTIRNSEQSVFNDISQLKEIIHSANIKTPYSLMINYAEFPLEKIENCTDKNLFLRIAFKQTQLTEALDYCQKIQDKGYKIFIHPIHTGTYSKEKIIELIQRINQIKPFGLTIVDTTGSMDTNSTRKIFDIFDKNLAQETAIAFHSHNNLNLSLLNAKELIKRSNNRLLILDTTLGGIGRGAGNLKTESILEDLNKTKDLDSIMEIVEKIIAPIYKKSPWGYSTPYHHSATYFCHPNYAKYLIEKNIPDNEVKNILQSIPEKNRLLYDEKLIERLTKICNEKVIK